MTRLILIRHAETDWNVEGRYQGQSDIPLNARGRQQAAELAGVLQNAGLSAIYSSDLMRAGQTAEALAQAAGLEVQTDPRLREIDQGEWEGMLFSDILAGYSELLSKRKADPLEVTPPGGEPLLHAQVRILAAVQDIIRRHPNDTVAVVSHGVAIALIRVHYLGLRIEQIWDLIPSNTGPIELEVDNSVSMVLEKTGIADTLISLYGEETGRAAFLRLYDLLKNVAQASRAVGSEARATFRDVILITYGNQVQEPGAIPLRTLADFCRKHLQGVVNTIHLLPFYPYSSDDGFSVTDYRAVDPALGDWDDVAGLGRNFRLMFDAVINHVSSQSRWFRAFLQDDPAYRDYFLVVDGNPDLSQVVRPRALPLLNSFPTLSGEKRVWTTFSADQIDLDYHNPAVLLEMIDTLLFYLSKGAQILRLDAVAYLWKEPGTTCIHLAQTHLIIQLLRAVLNVVAPRVLLITETNVPHGENVSYWGDGTNEAHLVYNFALPPLLLHAFHTGSARQLTRWAQELRFPSGCVTFLNFLASHDGIGLNPVRGILNESAIDMLVSKTLSHGGRISYKDNENGTRSPYELNINYFDALSNPQDEEPLDTQVQRFATAHACMLSFLGMPAVYFHSLFGSRGWLDGVALTGHNRSINRRKLMRPELDAELADRSSLRWKCFDQMIRLFKVRSSHQAFDPYGKQQVLDCGESIFALLRTDAQSHEHMLCLHNVSAKPRIAVLPFACSGAIDIMVGTPIQAPGKRLEMQPYQFLWMKLHD